MNNADLIACGVTLRLALSATAILLVVGIPLSYWLARSRSFVAKIAGALVTLPLILPPTVLGFYLLLLMGPYGAVGKLTAAMGGEQLVFSFNGLLLASVLFSLPFVVQPLRAGFVTIPPALLDAAAVLRSGPLDRFMSIVLPLNRTGIITAAAMGFAHTVGEFGVVLMVGGSIPGKTRVLSIALFEHVEAMEYQSAHILAAILIGCAVLILTVAQIANSRAERWRR